MTLRCPHCGGAITALVGASVAQSVAQIGEPSGANPASNGKVAQMSLGSTKDGRQAYNQDYPEDFEVFWSAYPLHRDKRKALNAWRKSLARAGANPADAMAQILAGANRYRNDPNRQDEFTKYAEGWLNADGWLDEPLPMRGGPRDNAAAILRRAAAKGGDARGSLPG